MMKHELEGHLTRWLGLALLLLLSACVSSREPTGLGGESHFLRRCEDQCGSGLDCIQGVCTRGCVVGKASCSDLSPEAMCTAGSVEPGEVGVCDLACGQDADCAALSTKHLCEAGFCRAPAPAVVDAGSATSPDAGSTTGGGGGAQGNKVSECSGDVSGDPVDVNRFLMQGNTLVLQVAYGGGCKDHTFSLCYGPEFGESYPVQTTLRLVHDAHGDTCEAYPSQELRFDLTPLAAAYERSYRSSAGQISTNYGIYAFGKLSCEEREMAAAGQVSQFERQVSRECQTNADCRWTSISTSCTARCGTIASNAGAVELGAWLAVTSSAVCGDYEAAGCGPVIIPPCVPPGPLACVAGQCKAAQ
jgi:hypothetical protein